MGVSEEGQALRNRNGNGKDDAIREGFHDFQDELHKEVQSDLSGEYGNIAILLVLYTLQGIPMGLSSVLTMILKERGASYSDVGTFSLNSWPFCLKLLWAPLVDTVYSSKVGRRKTWLVPAQLLIGIVMIAMSAHVDGLLYAEKPAVVTLTALFFFLYFLCATQDIAVDGWALTMLRPENVGWAATTNAFGQTVGTAIGFTGYMVLEQSGKATLSTFMSTLGVVFLLVTIIVAVFKSENPVPDEEEPEDLVTSYRTMLSMASCKPVRLLTLVLFTWKIPFAIMDSVAPLKLQDKGIPKEHITYLVSALMPLYIVLPLIATRWTTSQTPLNLAMCVYPLRLFMIVAYSALIYFAPSSVDPLPYGFYSMMALSGAMAAVASSFMFVSSLAFFTRVSDPAMGGTYMTLLNTMGNVGGTWPNTMAFYLVDAFTCHGSGCVFQLDGYYTVSLLSIVFGLGWISLGRMAVQSLQELPLDKWKVR